MFDYLALTACSVGTARSTVFAAVDRPVFVCSLSVPVFLFSLSLFFVFHILLSSRGVVTKLLFVVNYIAF